MPLQQEQVRELARKAIEQGQPFYWFDELYSSAKGDASLIPWANLAPNPNLMSFLKVDGQSSGRDPAHRKALVVGCGLGDDAQALYESGYEVTAFDLSSHCIAWCRQRFPASEIAFLQADLFDSPDYWHGQFDLVLEIYTLQAMPIRYHQQACACISKFVKPGGKLLVVTRGREASEKIEGPPWPLTQDELVYFEKSGLHRIRFEELVGNEKSTPRTFRALYQRILSASLI
ncbi:MAG: class I SAM-dependent methyltransferase [Planctomycetales bacterium]|nr:class I SAM-dependent methyltransferase [Planctomycetales bacterium]